jgi:RNA polymerase sigma-70 factor (ECF subfamily)
MGTLADKFPTTDWSVVHRTAAQCTQDADGAIAVLCEHYWYPLYACLRRRGYGSEDAEDLTQAFLASVVEKNRQRRIFPEQGRFRAFLLTALLNFAAKQNRRARAQKRGGRLTRVIDAFDDAESRYARELAAGSTPERVFDRSWAVTLLNRVLHRLEHEYASAGKAALFRHLQQALVGDPDRRSHVAAAAALTMSEAAVRVAGHRLRRRYRDLLRDEIGRTVFTPGAIDDEIRYLLAVVTSRE